MTRTALIAGEGRLASAIAAALDAPLVYALDHLQPQVPARPFRLDTPLRRRRQGATPPPDRTSLGE